MRRCVARLVQAHAAWCLVHCLRWTHRRQGLPHWPPKSRSIQDATMPMQLSAYCPRYCLYSFKSSEKLLAKNGGFIVIGASDEVS
jgi:hypothetical protein